MIGRISGRLDWRGQDHVLIDVRGVGYIVHVSERTLAGLPGIGEAVSFYTDLLVREDLLQLFGFPTMLEKEWHKLLMTVQGVGPKLAQRVILELKAKAPGVMASGVGLSSKAAAEDVVIEETAPAPRKVAKVDEGAARRASASADALSALVNLGYGQGDAAQAVATVAGDMADVDAAALIRAALKVLAPK